MFEPLYNQHGQMYDLDYIELAPGWADHIRNCLQNTQKRGKWKWDFYRDLVKNKDRLMVKKNNHAHLEMTK